MEHSRSRRRWRGTLALGCLAVVALSCSTLPADTASDAPESSTTASTTTAPETSEAPATTAAPTSDATTSDTQAAGSSDGETQGIGAETLNDPYVGSFGNGGYDVQAYDLSLAWDQATENLDGLTVIEATATQDLVQFNLDLVGLTVEAVQVNGNDAAVERDGSELTVIPTVPLDEGETFTTTVTYAGTPVFEPGPLGSSVAQGWRIQPDSAYVIGEPIAASTFHPANDHPSDKARFTYRLTAPSDQTAIAGGNFISKTDNDDGTSTWVYEQDEPLTTYLTTLMIGPFEVREGGTSASGVRIRNVFYSPIADQAEPIFADQPAMMDFFESILGPYPFDVYGSAVVGGEIGGALETQTLSIYGSDVLLWGPFAERVVAHELAHQWFGNSVSIENWEDLWLNEGFASYSEALWLEHSDPDGGGIERWLAEASAAAPALNEPVHKPPTDELFGFQVYIRGGLTLHGLRLEVGDDVFFEILRTWVERFRNSNASSADFEALAEELSGDDLSLFFDAWLRQNTMPALSTLQ